MFTNFSVMETFVLCFKHFPILIEIMYFQKKCKNEFVCCPHFIAHVFKVFYV